jgi:hypothetical protein
MAAREKILNRPSKNAEAGETEELVAPNQRRRPESGRYRLQVDRQTKRFFEMEGEAEQAGLAIKNAYPVVQVIIYDTIDGVSKTIEPVSSGA